MSSNLWPALNPHCCNGYLVHRFDAGLVVGACSISWFLDCYRSHVISFISLYFTKFCFTVTVISFISLHFTMRIFVFRLFSIQSVQVWYRYQIADNNHNNHHHNNNYYYTGTNYNNYYYTSTNYNYYNFAANDDSQLVPRSSCSKKR